MLNIAIIIPGLYLLQPLRLFKCWIKSRKNSTPRQRYRRKLSHFLLATLTVERMPPCFNLSFALLPFLIALFYAFSLIFLFPLLAVPIFILAYLSLVVSRYMIERVFVERFGYSGAEIGLWMTRRFGWVLGIQPCLYSMIVLSRREWVIGGCALGVAVVVVGISEILTVGRDARSNRPSKSTREIIERITRDIKDERQGGPSNDIPLRQRGSELSILQRVTDLLPTYSRLPPECAIPLKVEYVDDMLQTEKAAFTRTDLASSHIDDRSFFHDPSESIRGLVYPPEMLMPVPVVWLANDTNGVAEGEASDLERYHGLAAIVDPSCKLKTGKAEQKLRIVDDGGI